MRWKQRMGDQNHRQGGNRAPTDARKLDNPKKFLSDFLNSFKMLAGIEDLDPEKIQKIDPQKILKSLKTTEQKLSKLEEARNRFHTDDIRSFEEWKKQSCADELAKLSLAIAARESAFNELKALQKKFEELHQPKKNIAEANNLEEDDTDDDFNFTDFDDSIDDGNYFEGDEEENDEDNHGEFKGSIGEINFVMFYKITGWDEDFLRQITKLASKDRKEFVAFFYNELIAGNDPRANFYEFFALVDSHANRLLELDEDKEMLSAVKSGDINAQIKHYYRKLMMKLHPDLRGDNPPTETEKNIFLKVQIAYKASDLAGLQRAEIDFALFRGKLDSSADPRLLKKLQDEKSSDLKTLQKDMRQIKKNIEWDFSSKSTEERRYIKSHVTNEIFHQFREAMAHRSWIQHEIQQLNKRLNKVSSKEHRKSTRSRRA